MKRCVVVSTLILSIQHGTGSKVDLTFQEFLRHFPWPFSFITGSVKTWADWMDFLLPGNQVTPPFRHQLRAWGVYPEAGSNFVYMNFV